MKIASSLANKYRPKDFSEVIGQDAAVKRIQGFLKSGTVPHGILLCGTTGTGKTTLGRLIASYVNAEKGKPVDVNNHPDIKQINAGDVRKIDDIRILIQEAAYRPQRGAFRIICMNEIQQLTHDSVQALLEPLEEPPEKTIYILTTMEPEKLNKAMVGRCSIFNLEIPSQKDIAKNLLRVAKKEKMKWLDKKSALEIAEASNGQVRDSLSMLEAVQQYLGSSKETDVPKVLKKALQSVLKVADDESAKSILKALYVANPKKLQAAITSSENIVSVLNKMTYLNQYVINRELAPDAKGVAHWGINKEFYASLDKVNVKKAILIQSEINACKQEIGTFMSNDWSILTARLGTLCFKFREK